MATETQEIVPVDGENEEIITTESKIEYSVKSEVISTVKTHETVVTEVRTETIENHVQDSIEAPNGEPLPIENGEAEEIKEEVKEDEPVVEEEKPKENGEPSNEEQAASSEDKPAEASVEEPKVEANAELVVEAEVPASTNGEAEKSPEEVVQELPPKVILHQLPRVKDLVSQSPQCLALETFLRMAELPYDNEYEEKAQDVSKENKGKIPYICYKKTKVEGLKNCLRFLKNEFEVATDKHLSPQDEAIAHAFRTMIEESTYWSLMYYRWVDNYSESKKMFSKLPPVLNVVSPKMFQNKCKKSIESHVIGRYSRDELYNIAEQDLTALSTFLGEKSYFLGEEPCSFDATAFGLLANFDGASNCPQSTLIQEKLINLHDFCSRMKEKYWPDWSDLCGADKFQEKPKSGIKKRFSFRKTKTNKEGEATSPSDEKSPEEGKDGETKENGEAKENGETKENGAAGESAEATVNGEHKEDDKESKETTDEKKEGSKDETPQDEQKAEDAATTETKSE